MAIRVMQFRWHAKIWSIRDANKKGLGIVKHFGTIKLAYVNLNSTNVTRSIVPQPDEQGLDHQAKDDGHLAAPWDRELCEPDQDASGPGGLERDPTNDRREGGREGRVMATRPPPTGPLILPSSRIGIRDHALLVIGWSSKSIVERRGFPSKPSVRTVYGAGSVRRLQRPVRRSIRSWNRPATSNRLPCNGISN